MHEWESDNLAPHWNCLRCGARSYSGVPEKDEVVNRNGLSVGEKHATHSTIITLECDEYAVYRVINA